MNSLNASEVMRLDPNENSGSHKVRGDRIHLDHLVPRFSKVGGNTSRVVAPMGESRMHATSFSVDTYSQARKTREKRRKPVAFPRVNDFWVGDGVEAGGAVELIEEKLDNWRKRRVDVQDCREEIVDVLLQRAL